MVKRFFLIALAGLAAGASWSAAGTKNFSGAGDDASWHEDANWSPAGVPTEDDDVRVTQPGSEVTASRTFNARTLVLGEGFDASVTSSPFVFGEVNPGSPLEDAVLNSPGGLFVLQGSAGTVTLRGTYHDSLVVPDVEASALFWLE
jgi:hypothetical protein